MFDWSNSNRGKGVRCAWRDHQSAKWVYDHDEVLFKAADYHIEFVSYYKVDSYEGYCYDVVRNLSYWTWVNYV